MAQECKIAIDSCGRAPKVHFLADLHDDVERLFARMTCAYQVLTQEKDRMEYDSGLHRPQADHRDTQIAAKKDLARQNYKAGKKVVAEGKLMKALIFFQNAVKADDERAEYLEALGAIQALNPQLKAHAERNLKLAIKLEPSRASAFLMLALLFAKLGRAEHAERRLKEALAWDPTYTPARLFESFLKAGGQNATGAASGLIKQVLQEP